MAKKRKRIRATTRKDRAIDRLYAAVANYIEVNGGKVVVIGGVQMQTWPSDSDFHFTVGVKCTGRRPTPPQLKP